MTEVTTSQLFTALMHLLTADGVQASSWDLFQGAIFGRDSERVALDLVPWMGNISTQVIFCLARHQGTKHDPITEEEPGRIHHEYRHLFVGGRRVKAAQQELLKELSEKWGGSEKEMIYYGSVDATPQFVRLVAAHCRHYGEDILHDEFIHRNGSIKTLHQAVVEALAWLTQRISSSDLGLLEFKRSNPRGITWQAMRDGALAYIHADGSVANANAPIASLEVQGLAYDALLEAVGLLGEQMPEQAATWLKMAKHIQEQVCDLFWMEKEQFFAMGIDRDEQGKSRLIKTISSVPAELLESRLFDSLSKEKRNRYLKGVIRKMYSQSFLTDVGIRSRALEYHDLVPLWDYQGSKVSWVVTTNIFTQGLRRQGFERLAYDMEERMLRAAREAEGSLFEYLYVDTDGSVHYFHNTDGFETAGMVTIVGTNMPESTQAWTVSALLSILLQREQPRPATFPAPKPATWQVGFEETLLSQLTPGSYTSVSDKENRRSFTAYIDRDEGRRREREFLAKYGYFE